ncbi:ribonuclease J [Tropicimonas sp. IMCC34043]|uniref:ribonuclease J n=1 Tax=Tropicimonas sp. IMCC34043 TaxID=2248760 RepID=UPI000E270B1B|nr:ribonuclease J [Tropicimonas sp. IMCC34043]
MSDEARLIYLPLGGAGEVGMNAYVYGYGKPGKERLILVDLGVTFPDMDTTPGVDLIFPDISWLIERADRLEAIVITHGHEDHIGALGHFWNDLRVPVYCRKFTGNLAARKMDEHGADPEQICVVGAWPEVTEAGPFRIGFLPVSHSIPESSGLVIDTPAGRIVHTGDFKLDGAPGVGEPFDAELWHSVAGDGVRALVCDSTNIFVETPGRSESTLSDNIRALVASSKGMVISTTFASNVARVKTLAEAGRDAGRSVCLLGRAMQRMVAAAIETGVLTDFPTMINHEEAEQLPREHVMLIVTGSQGERRAATAQFSRGKYLGLELAAGDTFLFSSKTIPGNERAVLKILNAFSERGVDVVDDNYGLYHVSGHANRPDLEAVHDLMRPRMLIPMHGEHRMLRRHAEAGEAKGIASMVAVNGTMLDLTGDRPVVVDRIETGRVYLDGTRKIGALGGVVRDRIRMALNGLVMLNVIFDEKDEPLGDPWAEIRGLAEKGRTGTALVEMIETETAEFMARAGAKVLRDDEKLETSLRRVVRQVAVEEIGKKPEVTVVISRLA